MAKAKLIFDGDLPDYLKDIAVAAEEGEGYELDVDSLADLPKLNEFRSNNRQLFNDKEALKGQLEGAASRVAELEQQLQQGTQKAKTTSTSLEQRIKALEEANAAKDEALAAKEARLQQQAVQTALADALTEAGIQPKALPDAIEVAAKGWRVEDGGLRYYRDGDLVLSADRAGEPINEREFAVDFLKARPHFLAESSGDLNGNLTFRQSDGKVRVDATDPVAKGLAERKYGADKIEYVYPE